MPCLEFWLMISKQTSPRLAWSTILRATSEIAAAIMVTSVPRKPSCCASVRPCWRAITISTAESMGTRVALLAMFDAGFLVLVQVGQTFLQVERSAYAFQGESQLHDGEGDI